MKYIFKDFRPGCQEYNKEQMCLTIKYCDHQTAQTFISCSFFVYFDVNHCLLYHMKTQVIWSKFSKIFVCLTVFVFSKCCQLKREAWCLHTWFWNICQNVETIANRLYLQHQENLSGVTVNQKMFDCQKTCTRVNGSNGVFALNLWVQRRHIPEAGRAGKVHPFLLHDSAVCVTCRRPGWLWVPWIGTVVFKSAFQVTKWRENSLPM